MPWRPTLTAALGSRDATERDRDLGAFDAGERDLDLRLTVSISLLANGKVVSHCDYNTLGSMTVNVEQACTDTNAIV